MLRIIKNKTYKGMKDQIDRLTKQILKQQNENSQLKNEKLPVILWGGGSMSYSVRKILKSIEIKIAACWIDNSPIEELEDGTRVYSYEESCKNFQKFISLFLLVVISELLNTQEITRLTSTKTAANTLKVCM